MNKKEVRFSFVLFFETGFPGTPSVDQAGLELRDPPASACSMLGLKAWPPLFPEVRLSLCTGDVVQIGRASCRERVSTGV